MTDPQDPTRLVDDPEGSERLRELLRESRNDLGSREQLKRLESRLVPLIWPPAAPAPTPTGASASAASASGVALKAATAVVVAVGLAGGGLWLAKSTQSPSDARVTPPSAGHVEAPPTPPATTGTEPSATTDESNVGPEDSKATTKERIGTGNGERRIAPAESASESESDLLGRAQAALRSDPARALSIAGEHKKRFPAGVLTQEREVLSIDALERLGRHSEAIARADRFLKSFPGSAHRSKVNAIVGRP